MLLNQTQYCEWVEHQADLIFYVLTLGFSTCRSVFSLWDSRKTKEYTFAAVLMGLLTIRLSLEFGTDMQNRWIDGLSLVVLSLTFAWVHMSHLTANYKKYISTSLLIAIVFLTLDSWSEIEN